MDNKEFNNFRKWAMNYDLDKIIDENLEEKEKYEEQDINECSKKVLQELITKFEEQ